MNTSRLSVKAYAKGILEGDRITLAKAITVVESTLPADQRLAGEVLDAVMEHTGNSMRIGITGAPGVGKSTFIEAFGKSLVQTGKKLAVLTIDPTSQRSRGSILGDKTRMDDLARNPMTFIRPTASGLTLGGVATHTRETILLCEAAGYEWIIVETVGTGQSETAIKGMVDFFLLLMLAGSGDELQGIKKGIVEMADAIAITKADGDNLRQANAAQADFTHALHLLQQQRSGWAPKVVTCSALTGQGLDAIRAMIEQFKQQLSASGYFEVHRTHQQVTWFTEHFNYLMAIDYRQYPDVIEAENILRQQILSHTISPHKAAQTLIDKYYDAILKRKR